MASQSAARASATVVAKLVTGHVSAVLPKKKRRTVTTHQSQKKISHSQLRPMTRMQTVVGQLSSMVKWSIWTMLLSLTKAIGCMRKGRQQPQLSHHFLMTRANTLSYMTQALLIIFHLINPIFQLRLSSALWSSSTPQISNIFLLLELVVSLSMHQTAALSPLSLYTMFSMPLPLDTLSSHLVPWIGKVTAPYWAVVISICLPPGDSTLCTFHRLHTVFTMLLTWGNWLILENQSQ